MDYSLSLYYSYLLPLFDVELENGAKSFVKRRGACAGLKCIDRGRALECFVPEGCSDYESMLGINRERVVRELAELLAKLGLKANFISKFRVIHSASDKLQVFMAIYLSRNTDYYRNAVNWVVEIVDNSCIESPEKCVDRAKSYQYRELVRVLLERKLLRGYSSGEVIEEGLSLLSIRGFGVKSLNAYLLHAYGLTQYAPIDRHYKSLLSRVELRGSMPSKDACRRAKLNCRECSLNNACIYSASYRRHGKYNGVIQSMNYVYCRLKRFIDGRPKMSSLEEKLVGRDLERYIDFVNEFERFIDLLNSIDKLGFE